MRCEPIGERVFDALASPVSSVPGSVVPRLGSAFSSMTSPVALVLDDVHVLHNSGMPGRAVGAGRSCAGRLAAGAGRAGPSRRCGSRGCAPRAGSWRSAPATCRSPVTEASSLLRDAGVALGEDEVAELHRRTEGWPAGLYLAALYLREGGPLAGAAVSFGGDDRLVSEYVESEFLARISRAAAGVPDPDRGAGADVRAAVRGGARRCPGPPRPWRSWPGRTCCWCRWTGGGSGTATTTCSATCCWRSCTAWSPA